uniref:PDZ domain-containing protein n=1 Tax=Macrostomum lignano TaxID=282301 RepID=A0A1I8INY3_9PLAT
MTQGGYTLAGAVDSSDKQQEELLEIDLIRHPGKPLGIEFLFGHLSLPRGPTSGLFVRRVDRQTAGSDSGEASLLEEGDFVLSANGQELRTAATEAAALEAIRKAGRQCRLRVLRSDFVRSEFLNCLVRSLNGGGVIGGSRRGPSAVDDDVAVHQRRPQQQRQRRAAAESASPTRSRHQAPLPPTQKQPQSMPALSSGARVPLELELAWRLGKAGRLRNSVGGGGCAVRSVRGRRQRHHRQAVLTAEALIRHRQSGGFEARDKLDVVDSGAAKQRPFVAATSTSTGSQTALTGPAQDAAVAAAKSEARELADQCAALQRRLDDAEAANERDRRRLAVLAGELRKSGRHSNRLATALQATLDLLGRLANLDQAERAEADAVAVRAAELLSNEGVDGNDDLPPGWEPAQLRPGGAEAAAAVFANHAEGRVARQPPAAGNSKRAEQEAEPEVDGPKRLQRYRMDILDRNGVPRFPRDIL